MRNDEVSTREDESKSLVNWFMVQIQELQDKLHHQRRGFGVWDPCENPGLQPSDWKPCHGLSGKSQDASAGGSEDSVNDPNALCRSLQLVPTFLVVCRTVLTFVRDGVNQQMRLASMPLSLFAQKCVMERALAVSIDESEDR